MNAQSNTAHSQSNAARLAEIKARVDCRAWYQHTVGTGKRSGRSWSDRVPWRADRHASLGVFEDGYVDFATEERGDIFDLVQHVCNLPFTQAVAEIRRYIGDSIEYHAPRVYRKPAATHSDPPPAAWQAAALAAVERGEQYLWSDRPDAKRALAYLRDQRGLSDATIRAARLGFNPAWLTTGWRKADGKFAKVAPGIVIPCFVDDALWYVKTRCIVGDLAAALHRKPELWNGEESPKYVHLADGQPAALFNADALQPDLPALVVEGEFDCLLTGQRVGDLLTPVTVGSASSTVPARWRDQLTRLPAIIAVLDNDQTGQAGKTREAVQAIGGRVTSVPVGKDITDFVVRHGGDLRAWITIRLQRAATYWDSVPDAWRSAIANNLPDPVAPTLELLAESWLLTPGSVITRPMVNAEAAARAVSPDTIRRGLEAAEGVFLERLAVLPIANPSQNSVACLDSESGCKTANTIRWRVLSLPDAADNLLARAAYRIWEHCNPTGKGDPLARPRPAFFVALGYSLDESIALAAALSEKLEPIYRQQRGAERFTERQAKAAYERLKRGLANPHSTPLPVGWTYRTVSEYRACFARAIKAARPTHDLSLKEWAETLGCSVRSVPSYLEQAGIASTAQTQDHPITAPADVRRIGYTIKGYPRWMVVDGEERTFDDQEVQAALTAGQSVTVRYQIANKQMIVREVQGGHDAVTTRQPKPQNPSPPPIRTERGEGYFGPGFDPAYVRGWLAQAWTKLTGELVTGSDPPAHDLLGWLLGRVIERDVRARNYVHHHAVSGATG